LLSQYYLKTTPNLAASALASGIKALN